MHAALGLAESAFSKHNSPFGCVLTDYKGNLLVEAENTTTTDNNPLAHAEMNAIALLAKKFKTKKFEGVILVSTVQSCPMCFSAAYRSGIRQFLYGCAEDDTLVPKINVHELNKYCEPGAEIITGVLEKLCAESLQKARANS